jgi:hypothetical protein
MSVIVRSMSELKGAILRDGRVEIIEEPVFHEESQRWRALADVDGNLCVVELRVTPLPPRYVEALEPETGA